MRVLVVQAPPVPDENRFFANILEALNAPYRAYQSAARRKHSGCSSSQGTRLGDADH